MRDAKTTEDLAHALLESQNERLDMSVRDGKDHALSALAVFDARKNRVAERRFFGGLSLEETGHVLGISVATVEREWQAARAWLYGRLTGASA